MSELNPYLWLLLAILLLVPIKRWVQRHLQGILLILTRNAAISQGIYALIFLPGVVIHEGSHWLTARLLGVKVSDVSMLPQQTDDGQLRFGFVEIAGAGRIQSALIGIAPLIFGLLSLLILSTVLFDMQALVEAAYQFRWNDLRAYLHGLLEIPDLLLWLYLTFAISHAMLPSASDRASFWPLLLFIAVASLFLWLVVDQGKIIDWVNGWLASAIRYLALAFTFTLLVDLALMGLLWILERILTRLTGLKVSY